MSVGTEFKVDRNKMFFDRDAVKKSLGAKNATILSRMGSFVRRTARQSMRRRKKPSEPGTPPSAHSGKDFPRGPLLKKLMEYQFDPASKSVIVGPKGIIGKQAPSLQEFGGVKIIKTRIFTEKSGRRATPRQAETFKRKIADGSLTLTNRPTSQRSVHFPARPYMRPALVAELPKFPTLYAGQITG